MMKIAVVGPGYAGLSLSRQFARSGVSVLASDVDVQKVQLLNHGKSYMKHIEPSVSAELVSSGKFSASADFNRIPDQRGGGGDDLCANTAYQESRARYFLRDQDRPHARPAPGTMYIGCASTDNL